MVVMVVVVMMVKVILQVVESKRGGGGHGMTDEMMMVPFERESGGEQEVKRALAVCSRMITPPVLNSNMPRRKRYE